MPIVLLQLNGIVVDNFEASIVPNQIGHQQSCQFIVEMRKFEDRVCYLRRGGASAGMDQQVDGFLNEVRV